VRDDRPKCDRMTIEEATISNMWEIAAIVEVLEQKGESLCTKQDLLDVDREVHRRLTEGRGACAPWTPQMIKSFQITESSICIRIHATTDTPELAAVDLSVGEHGAVEEPRGPRERGNRGIRRRRPITLRGARLDIQKRMT
jgi:hypothetical protein